MKIVLLRIQHFYLSKQSLHRWHNWILVAIFLAIFKYKIYKDQKFRSWVLCACFWHQGVHEGVHLEYV